MNKFVTGFLAAVGLICPVSAYADFQGEPKMPAYQLDAEISVFIGGMEILKFDWETNYLAGRYQSASHVYPVGIASILFDVDVNSWASGHIVDGRATPDSFESRYLEDGEEVRSVKIDFDRDGPFDLTRVGGDLSIADEDILAQVAGMIDPLSAAMFNQTFMSGDQVCAESHSIFSGESAYTIGFQLLGETSLAKSRYSEFEGPAYICEVAGQPLAAFNDEAQARLDARSNENKPSKLYIGRVTTDAGDELLIPVKVLVPTDFGTAIAHLTRFSFTSPADPSVAAK